MTTAGEKALSFASDSKLLNRSRKRLVRLCHQHGVWLRQSYACVGPQCLYRANRYAHARQTSADVFPFLSLVLPSKYTGEIEQGTPSPIARLRTDEIEMRTPYADDSFFSVQGVAICKLIQFVRT